MDRTLGPVPERLPSFARSLGRKFNGLSLGRKAKELVGYLPLAHVSGELDRIIIRSRYGNLNNFLIEQAAKNELTYKMLASSPSDFKEADAIVVNSNGKIVDNLSKKNLLTRLSSLMNVVLISRSQDDHYKINIFSPTQYESDTRDKVLILIDEGFDNFSSSYNSNFSTLGILTPHRNITSTNIRNVLFDFDQFKLIVHKFKEYSTDARIQNSQNITEIQTAIGKRTMTEYIVPQENGPRFVVAKKNSPKVAAKLAKKFRGFQRYAQNRVINPVRRVVGGVPRSASVSRTLKARS